MAAPATTPWPPLPLTRRRRSIMTHPVMQFQILSKRPDESAAFYGRLFGWRVDDANALGYRTLDARGADGRGITGGIWPAGADGHAMVQLYVQVTDVQKHVARAKDLGAKV